MNQPKQAQILDSSATVLKNPEPQLPESSPEPVNFFSMFRFATRIDYLIMGIGTVAAICNGASMPLFALLWGDMLDSFKSRTQMVDQTKNMLLLFIYIGLAVFFTGWVMIACWLITGERQSIQCRKEYLKSLLRQEIGWFDSINQAELSSQFSADTMAFQQAISDKIPLVLYVIAMGISGMVVAFAKGWLLTLVLLGVFPVLIASMYLYMYNVQNKGKRQEKSYATAGGRAEQALAAIKTVKMLNGQNYESFLYDECLEQAGKGTVKYGAFAGLSLGGAFFAMLTAYSLGFWYGANCIEVTQRCPSFISRQEYTAGIVFTVFFSVIIVGFNMSQLPPSLKKITEGRAAAGRIFAIIDRQPLVKNPVNGIKISDFKGVIKFKNVTFRYPKQPNKKILDGLNLQINKNKIAFVGESGCGKSTIMQLIMRFYDPDEGTITIDGHDLKTIDLIWLREAIGYVGQEPVLFDTTIRENLLFANDKATQEQLESALKKAEALEFVKKLEKGMDTNVGLGGGQISGGQKQRIAIARAILRDPKILLLDEATSALDRKNEKLIQRTLNKISQARTSITIAHRVKTVMNSDEIFVIDKGRVKQHGKFQQLKRFEGMQIEKEAEQQQNMIKNNVEKDDELPQQNLVLQKKLTKQEIKLKQKEELLQVYNKSTYRRVFSYAEGNGFLFFIGILASGALGSVYPVFSIFLSSMLQIMLTKKQFMDEANTKALIFFLLGVLGLLLSIVQNMIFEYIGQKITRKIRSETFNKLMKLPIYWYERPQNGVGSLTARLAVDCKKVKDMTTTTIYGLVQNVSTLLTGLIIAFIFEWRTSLVALGLIPFLIAAGAIRMAFRTGSATKAEQAYKNSSNLIMQSMTNIRTVCSFGYENIIFNKYSRMMEQPFNLAVKNGIVSGFFYGIAQLIMFVVIALIFYLGSLFVQNNGVGIENMFTAIFAIFFSAMTVGNNSHILPDLGQCKVSAANLFLILDTKDESQIQIDENSKLLKNRIRGDIVLKDIKFKYDTRSEYLFDGFSMVIPYGEKVAFVGTSGCGKSTILAFLQRFYQPESGTILLDGVNIKDYDIHFLRAQFGVVSQQPVLFNASFKQNIKYNLDKATDQQIIQATKQAHAYDFIMGSEQEKLVNNFIDNKPVPEEQSKSQPKTGFDRSVGIKGSHISGGQKQRVAIARAILRKPEILLLDEATSALDSVNEKKVQECLDEIMANKSSISIAHRLDTIRNSKVIYVFDKGRIAESGNYDQLLQKKGYFYNLERGIEFK